MSSAPPNLASTESAIPNSTFTDPTIDDIPEGVKTASYVLTSLMLLYSLYINIGMLSYGTKWKKWRIKKKAGQIYIVCFLAIALGFVNILMHLVQTAVIENQESCVISGHFDNIFGVLAMFSIYLFLWMRHKVIYDSPMVESFTHKSVKVISWLLLVLTLGFLAFSILDPMIARAMRSNFCLLYFQGNWIVFSFSILSQIAYCVLFIYPMIQIHLAKQKNSQQLTREVSPFPSTDEHKVMNVRGSHDNIANRNGERSPTHGANGDAASPRSKVYFIQASTTDRYSRNAIGKVNSVKPKEGKLTKHAAKLNKTVRRCLICAVVTVVTDFIFIAAAEATLAMIPNKYTRKLINNIMFDFDIILNGTAVLSTFTGFADIMAICVPRSWRNSSDVSENSTSNTS